VKIFVKAKPKSKKAFVKKIDDIHFIVAVSEPPVGGLANLAIIKSLAQYFHKPKSQIFIASGEKSKQKIIEVPITETEIADLQMQKKLF